MAEAYNINPALDRAIRNRLKLIRDTQDAMLSGQIPVDMGTQTTCEECRVIENLLTTLGKTRKDEGLRGTLDRAGLAVAPRGGDGA